MRLPETFVCEVCGDELPCMGFERSGAADHERSSTEYPNKLCEWCWHGCLINDGYSLADRAEGMAQA